MIRIIILVLLCIVTGLVALWAMKTGGTVSFHGKGWDFQISLWAFLTSFLSGAGLLWIGVALLLWVVKSPLRVFSWIQSFRQKDKTAHFLQDIEFLARDMIAPVKKHMPYKSPLIQAYLEFKVALYDKSWSNAEAALATLETYEPSLTSWGRMHLEKAKGDDAMALRYGLEVYKNHGPVSFLELLDSAEKSQSLEKLNPYWEAAYKQKPSWAILRHVLPQWEQQGQKRKALTYLKKLWEIEQNLSLFQEICRLEAITSPLERAQLFKKLTGDQTLTLQGYEAMHQTFQEAGLWGEAEEAQRKILPAPKD